jgi:hypothetical protein
MRTRPAAGRRRPTITNRRILDVGTPHIHYTNVPSIPDRRIDDRSRRGGEDRCGGAPPFGAPRRAAAAAAAGRPAGLVGHIVEVPPPRDGRSCGRRSGRDPGRADVDGFGLAEGQVPKQSDPPKHAFFRTFRWGSRSGLPPKAIAAARVVDRSGRRGSIVVTCVRTHGHVDADGAASTYNTRRQQRSHASAAPFGMLLRLPFRVTRTPTASSSSGAGVVAFGWTEESGRPAAPRNVSCDGMTRSSSAALHASMGETTGTPQPAADHLSFASSVQGRSVDGIELPSLVRSRTS